MFLTNSRRLLERAQGPSRLYSSKRRKLRIGHKQPDKVSSVGRRKWTFPFREFRTTRIFLRFQTASAILSTDRSGSMGWPMCQACLWKRIALSKSFYPRPKIQRSWRGTRKTFPKASSKILCRHWRGYNRSRSQHRLTQSMNASPVLRLAPHPNCYRSRRRYWLLIATSLTRTCRMTPRRKSASRWKTRGWVTTQRLQDPNHRSSWQARSLSMII